MASRVRIVMKSSDVHYTTGYARQVVEEIEKAKLGGKMLALEDTGTPAGQMFYLDPHEIESVKDKR
jgi:hypothetical protein